ncbi:hypothetical protein [Ruegeria sp.]|uniref:tetratricopeptide repeat protein n=1 Tax=Ruegeria sp. TaxID=1879320 RepID=UPI0023228650|nr:hypothetical protein [Ruegeria sp.]MDA7966992.1 hypothetical protein [Ruegeria sp.]
MKSDPPVATQKRPFSFVRVLALFGVLAIFPVLYLADKHEDLVKTCNLNPGEPQDTLAACDTLLTWTAWTPETRSLMHRHKMRVFIKQKDWDAALQEVDLAIAEDPQSPVPWQWKSLILARAEDYRASLRAIDEALKLDPEDEYSLKNKYKLLSELEEYGAIDDMVSQNWSKDESADWLPGGEQQEITWNPSRFPKSQAAFLEYALKLRDDLAGDLYNPKLRWQFTLSCTLLAANCPPLLPEKRGSYPNLECNDVIEDYSRERPVQVGHILKNTEYQTLRDLFDSGTQLATRYISGEYVSTFSSWFSHSDSQAIPSDLARRLIQAHKLFDCVSGGKFVYLELSEEEKEDYEWIGLAPMEKEEFEWIAEKQFNMALRLNFLDLAHVYAN